MPYIGKSPHFGVRNRFIYTASADATSISGADANGATLTFTDGAYVDVYLNGLLLKAGTDYVTTTANTIGSLAALSTSDEVVVLVYDVFTVGDMVSATSGGTFNSDVKVKGDFSVISEATSGYSPTLRIDRRQTDAAGANDPLGDLDFRGKNAASEDTNYFRMRGKIKVATDGSEEGLMNFKIMTDGTLTDRIAIQGGEPVEFKGGDVEIDDGNLVVASGHGIDFSAVSHAGGMTSELFDSYEEGTFTLTMRGSSGSAGSVAGNTATCKYVKIGTLVYFNGDFNLTNVGSYSGNFLFSGLPFTVDGGNHPITLGGHQLDSDNATFNYLYFVTASNTTIDTTNPNVAGAIGWSVVGTGAYQVNGTYIVA